MVYTFDDADATDRRTTQYFEMLGNQGIYHDGWMASAIRGVPWLSEPEPGDLLNMPWELYHVDEDFSQANDLAKKNPEKLDELVKLFFAEAAKYNVLPLDDRKTERLNVDNRPSLTQGRTKFTYPEPAPAARGGRPGPQAQEPHDHRQGDDSRSRSRGHALHAGRPLRRLRPLSCKDGKLIYHYNLAGVERYTIASKDRIPTGEVTLKAVYKTDADKPFAGATVTLFANDKQIGEGRVEKSIPNRVTLDETLDIGFDTGTPVADGYEHAVPLHRQAQSGDHRTEIVDTCLGSMSRKNEISARSSAPRGASSQNRQIRPCWNRDSTRQFHSRKV